MALVTSQWHKTLNIFHDRIREASKIARSANYGDLVTILDERQRHHPEQSLFARQVCNSPSEMSLIKTSINRACMSEVEDVTSEKAGKL